MSSTTTAPPPLPPRVQQDSESLASSDVPDEPPKYAPTTIATAGQPLLRNGQILVFPIGKDVCPKCHNTGYKPFVGTGGDDPNHPCRNCWKKYGRPFSGAIQIAALSTPTPTNYQRPLRPQPVHRPPTAAQFGGYPGAVYHGQEGGRPVMQGQGVYGGGGGGGASMGMGYNGVAPSQIHVTHQPPMGGGAIVLRPGDPRLGGMRCYRCGGDGTTWGILFQDETCDLCKGVGRVF
ncbi:BQ2448_7215 [Microbotryum intermedium]|uniref:BQ2448_7215 protein n=1 Tax=Microbotryum intermedium TaxID=269621 RepID=A0A238FKG5_9BASI|nr:BQ2448_7215 [Microbotryum intermedium]